MNSKDIVFIEKVDLHLLSGFSSTLFQQGAAQINVFSGSIETVGL